MSIENGGIRINKYLSEYGICSRREADRLVESGKVSIDGIKARMGDRVMPGQQVLAGGRPVGKKDRKILLIFHKPKGVVCTSQKRDKNNIVDYIGYPVRVYPVGRLDQDSEGLILLTNYGPLANWLTHPSYCHEKEYVVRVDKEVTADFLRRMSAGIPILGKRTNPCKVKKTGPKEFSIVLTQGMNRQIRRMCEYLGCRVMRLQRIRIMDITLGSLPSGQYREATKKEWSYLMNQMEKVPLEKEKKSGGNYGRGVGQNERTGTKAKRSR